MTSPSSSRTTIDASRVPDTASHVKKPSLDSWDDGTEENELEEQQGDYSYSSRMEELMDDTDEEEEEGQGSKPDDDEGFLYDGADASETGGYRERLRDVLGPDHDDDEIEEQEVEKSLLHDIEDNNKVYALNGQGPPHVEVLSDHTPSTPPSAALSPSRMVSPLPSGGLGTPSKLGIPFLHPTISRLRSYTPQASRASSADGSAQFSALDGASPAPSHFSAMSRASTPSNLDHVLEHGDTVNGLSKADREVFRWTQLRFIGDILFAKKSQKVAAMLGSSSFGSPTVMAANGFICIGTDSGKVLVFDFRQSLKCICGGDVSVGPVTAVALSHDHTYVAAGHASGHIQLFDLTHPQTPARSVPPTSLAAVASGRQEGHLVGSRIVSIGFVSGRHTAVVSADENGLAFYHTLGKVLFVEASDILRILGKYPEQDVVDGLLPQLMAPGVGPQGVSNGNGSLPGPFRRRRLRKSNTILSMAALPLGTAPHPTDAYNVVALLTPMKLVVVGLKPTPKTWFRRHREGEDEKASRSKWRGAMAWYPSVTSSPAQSHSKGQTNGKAQNAMSTNPVLVYSWGDTLHLLRVSESKIMQKTRNPRNGKTSAVEVGNIAFEEGATWRTASGFDVLALQWLNANQIIVVTVAALEVYDVQSLKLVEHAVFEASSLISPTLSYTVNGSIPYADSLSDIAHSVRVYKGKIFLLSRQGMSVGTLLTWADRILYFVQNGDFLSAIDLTRSYYVGEAPGNRNGLPDKPEDLKEVVAQKMQELMVASARYAFSEERLIDETHITPDGRGVDRTSLFEGLVQTCARACIALDDFDFIFEDLFQYYDDSGIVRIFLVQLEIFILDGSIRYVPPRIIQRLISMHEEDGRPDRAERVIWHIEPECLDINQAIRLCQQHALYDALIYVYTRAMRDYVAPVVELISLIRKVMQYRKSRMEGSLESSTNSDIPVDDTALEPVIVSAYKIYPYLADVLSGLTYPSDEPLPEDEALQAKNDVYSFLFFGCSSVWPREGGKLVLTADEEGGVEPTYPYLRLLLRFDSEAFLHSLDIAFEDSYLNEETQLDTRLMIINVLLEILPCPGLSQADITFVNIFIARNVAKYSHFIKITPSALQGVLVGLAEDPDENTREDRQLAAEYLLSVYTPHDINRIHHLFQEAGFYRILRSSYRQEQQWAPLFSAYLEDPELRAHEVFNGAEDVLDVAKRKNKGVLPLELLATISEAIPHLVHDSITRTASLVDKYTPELHTDALEAMDSNADDKRFAYLRYLLGPSSSGRDEEALEHPRLGGPSIHVPAPLRLLYIDLHCRCDAAGVIAALKYLPDDFLDWSEVTRICEEHEVYDAVIWASNSRGDVTAALSKVETFESRLAAQIADILASLADSSQEKLDDMDRLLSILDSVGRMGIAVCLERSQPPFSLEAPVEDIWFQLLRSQIDCVQNVSMCCTPAVLDDDVSNTLVERERQTLVVLRSLVQDTFQALMSVSSTRAVSFPRLFKRLVDSSTRAHKSKGTPYTEFRAILTDMLESYRSDGDMLFITKHLVDRDVFETMELVARERIRGWTPSRGICLGCRQTVSGSQKRTESGSEAEDSPSARIVVSRTGAIYHSTCLPSESNSSIV